MTEKSRIKILQNKLSGLGPLKLIKKIFKFLKEIPEAILAIGLIALVLLCLYIFDNASFIQTEFPGLILDIAVFGVLIVIYKNIWDRRQERKNNIMRWQEEIDDFRGWDEKEAAHRIVGIIRRLNRIGINKFDLNHCYLKDMNLNTFKFEKPIFRDANLEGANFYSLDLKGANFTRAVLKKTGFALTKLQNAVFNGANFEEADLSGANLEGAILCGTFLEHGPLVYVKPNLSETWLIETNFRNSTLEAPDFHGAIVAETHWHIRGITKRLARFDNVNLGGADLRELKIHKIPSPPGSENYSVVPQSPEDLDVIVEVLSKAKSLIGAKLDPEIEARIKEKFPQLIEEPAKESKNSGERK